PGGTDNPSLQELTGATFRVEYTHPGEFEWVQPDWRHDLPSPARAPSAEAALQAARRIDPQVSSAQIAPTRLDLVFLYSPSGPSSRHFRLVRNDTDGWLP